MSDIAIKTKISRDTIRYWMEKYNIPKRSRSEASYYAHWGSQKKFPGLGKKLTVKEIKGLYYKKGYSARRTGEFFGRSCSSVYGFMKRHDLPRRSSAETNNIAYVKQKPSFVLKKNLTRQEEKLRVAGIMLYWGEGAKLNSNPGGNRAIDFANSDPKMIKLFLKFLREICGIDEKRLRAFLYCYVNQDISALKQYWAKITNISLDKFTKPYIRKDFLFEKVGKVKYGLVHIRYHDKKLLLQIGKWIEKYLKQNI